LLCPRLLVALLTPTASGPIVGAGGEECRRLSAAEAQLEEELQAAETEVHCEFLAQRGQKEGFHTDDCTELPAFYS
jgi:hypothetical protein